MTCCILAGVTLCLTHQVAPAGMGVVCWSTLVMSRAPFTRTCIQGAEWFSGVPNFVQKMMEPAHDVGRTASMHHRGRACPSHPKKDGGLSSTTGPICHCPIPSPLPSPSRPRLARWEVSQIFVCAYGDTLPSTLNLGCRLECTRAENPFSSSTRLERCSWNRLLFAGTA